MRARLLSALLWCALDGAALAQTPDPTDAQRAVVTPTSRDQRRYFEGMGRNPQEEQLFQDYSRAIELYEAETKEFRREVQQLLEKNYQAKRSSLGNSYEKAVGDFETLERQDRHDAIVQFEEFLQRYPKEPRFTPDILFRLAELYYERSSDDHLLAMRVFEEKLKAQDPDKRAELPPEPVVDFSPSIAVYRRLQTQFPTYRFNDGVTYLLGYCLEKQNDFTQSRKTYLELIARYPRSRFATEAWVRIGEYYFDEYTQPNALANAADAYEHAILDANHPLYDKALYKLGWTYYRMDRFDEAVARFLTLADFYEAQAKKAGKEEVGGDLRGEALQYTAISLADDKWGSLEKAKALFAKMGGRRYESEVYRRMGDVYFDQTRHTEAIDSYRLVLAKDPLSRQAPKVQQRIVEAYERDRKLNESFAEAQKMGALYGQGSRWHQKYQNETEMVNEAQALAEQGLYASAIYHHQLALSQKQDSKFEQAKASFEIAAQGYRSYLDQFPRSKQAYELEFYLAECLYNSMRFPEAGHAYERVRDSTLDRKFQIEAAFAAVLSYQKELERAVREGKHPDLKPLKSSERPEGQRLRPTTFSALEKDLVRASDGFLSLQPTEERAAGVAYKAAELHFVHNDFPEARRRFELIVKGYPKSEVAQFATNLIVESYLVDKDWKSVEDVSSRLAQNRDVIDPKSELYKDLVKFKLAGRFKLADELMQKGEFEQAAKKYTELVEEEPRHEFADKALNNAAVAYENTRRFDSALKLYERIYQDYPKSKLADAALFRVAVNAENSYDFDKAVVSYQKLVKEYPSAKDREAALFNAARLLEGQQRYPEAAAAFTRYSELFPLAEDAPKNHYRAALILEKQGDSAAQLRALDAFVRKYSPRKDTSELLVDARRRIGDAFRKLGKHRDARKAYDEAALEFDRRKLVPEQNPVAAEAAAQARFQWAEYEFKAFDALKIGGRNDKELKSSFDRKRAGVKKVNDAYGKVFAYKRLEWTLAALFRRGFALERFASTIIETPIPTDVQKLGETAVIQYQDLLAEQTTALEDKAVESYAATLAEAKKNLLSNEWTKKTVESLNRFRPLEYPVLKEARQALSTDAAYPDGLVGSLTGPPVLPPPKVRGVP
jgi:cellulose synthase operon protein C